MSGSSKTPLTYAQAGVDIEAGNDLVKRIGPLAKSTARPGADVDLGGFGGLFDLAACKFDDPVLVAANDGVGTKLKIAIEANKHDTVGIDLVAMCVNDLIVQGAEPLFFLDYFASGRLFGLRGRAHESLAETRHSRGRCDFRPRLQWLALERIFFGAPPRGSRRPRVGCPLACR